MAVLVLPITAISFTVAGPNLRPLRSLSLMMLEDEPPKSVAIAAEGAAAAAQAAAAYESAQRETTAPKTAKTKAEAMAAQVAEPAADLRNPDESDINSVVAALDVLCQAEDAVRVAAFERRLSERALRAGAVQADRAAVAAGDTSVDTSAGRRSRWTKRLRSGGSFVAKRLTMGAASLACAAAVLGPGALANSAVPVSIPAEAPAVVREADVAATALASAPVVVSSRARRGANVAVVSPTTSKLGGSRRRRSRRDGGSSPTAQGRAHGRALVGGQERENAILSVEDVPRPWRAGRRVKGERISDQAELINAQGRSRIMRTIREAESESGTEMMVVTLPTIGGQNPKTFATRLFNHWGIGRAEHNTGVLVLVVKDARRIEVEVGKDAVGKFSTAWTERMLSERVLPQFKQGRYSDGLARCVDTCAHRLSAPRRSPLASVASLFSADAWATVGLYGLICLGAKTGAIPAVSGNGSGGYGSSDGSDDYGGSGDYGGGSSDGGGGGGGSW